MAAKAGIKPEVSIGRRKLVSCPPIVPVVVLAIGSQSTLLQRIFFLAFQAIR
jgi:hypothetical protein